MFLVEGKLVVSSSHFRRVDWLILAQVIPSSPTSHFSSLYISSFVSHLTVMQLFLCY